MRISQRRWTLSGSGFILGSLDRQAKPLPRRGRVDALVVAVLGDKASEGNDPLRWGGDENVCHRRDRIALTGVTESVQPDVVETLDCVSLHRLCPSDRDVGVGEPKAQRRAVKRGRHNHDLHVVDRATARRAQTIAGHRLARDHQKPSSLHYVAREQKQSGQHVDHLGEPKHTLAYVRSGPSTLAP
ncbi:MAG: hypothetical protein ACXVHB_24575 [Solirubrobacteraceae bacterium]